MRSWTAMKLSPLRERLCAVPVLQGLPDPLRARVAMVLLWCGEIDETTAGRLLFVEGEQDEANGCVLIEGSVRVITGRGLVKRVESPELLGEMQQFGLDALRTATVQTATQVTLLRFSWDDVRKLAARILNPEEMDDFVLALSDRARARLEELSVAHAAQPPA